MAIVRMKKVTVVAMAEDKQAVLNDLMWLSAVDVSPLSEKLEDAEMAAIVSADNVSESLDVINDNISLLSQALKTYRLYSTEKRSLFTPYQVLSRADFEAFPDKEEKLLSNARNALRAEAELNSVKAEENRLDALVQRLSPWKALPFRLNEPVADKMSYFFGSMPLKSDITSVTEGIIGPDEEKAAAWTECLAKDKAYSYCLVICLASQERQLLSALAEKGFSRISFPDLRGTVLQNIEKIEKRKEELSEKRDAAVKQLKKYAEDLSEVEKSIDILSNNARLTAVREKILNTQSAFVLQGWAPVDRVDEVGTLLEKYGAFFFSEDPSHDEEPPIKLKNAKIVQPFEPITEMFALPTYRGLDPNFMVAPFYFLFFGMMLSDAGYGLLLAIGGFLILKFTNIRGSMRKMIKMFAMCGISTVVWGFLFGTFFGDAVGVISSTFFGSDLVLPPLWFDPVSDPITLLIVSFVVGFIHIMVGLGLKMYMLIRDGHYFSAIFDVGCWMILLAGIPVLLFSAPIGIIIVAAGALGLIVTQGRDKKGILGKIIGGVGSLYGITGYMSDILSYSRILALGLSAGVIGSVFNKLGSLGGANIVGVILFIVIFTIGHVLNLALSTLGAYVHASRLQFIEFFSKFYESGGRKFDEFGIQLKYTELGQ
jgi:V/A-type H+-transporting ATPase subunit I